MASMNKYLCLCLGVIFIFGALTCQALQSDDMNQKFEQWMSRYGRTYDTPTEKQMRFLIFQDNVAYIESSNSQNKSYKLGINQFADLTDEEFKTTLSGTFKGPARPIEAVPFRYSNVTKVPDFIDWSLKGAVTPVKNQGHCGCCWAFAAVACTEGLIKITTNKLVSLSEQELVDCAPSDHDNCHQPSNMNYAYVFIQANGLSSESDYPYMDGQGTCRQNKSSATRITGFEHVPQNDELALLHAVANQPVSVGIHASSDFKLYSSGVFDGKCETEQNHAVTIVGYGATSDGTKYWIIKNSWSTGWGMEGYMQIARDVSAPEGKCGLAIDASYPITSGMKPPTNGGRKADPSFIFFTFFITYFFKFLV